MSELDDDIARGCLQDGEPIEARWGSGWWSCQDREPEQDPWDVDVCEECGNQVPTFYGVPLPCDKCDWII